MSFVSPEYVIFFTVVIPLFFMLKQRHRWIMLLVMSYFFYGYGNIQYLPLIAFSTFVDYLAARHIAATEVESKRRLWLAISMGINLGILFTYKYFDFFNASFEVVVNTIGIPYEAKELNLILPIGVSFYTFQSMSYAIDTYRRQLVPEKNLGIMATYVAFFPQLVAGPIERATNLLSQFHIDHRFDVDRTVAGLQQLLWGFFKKVVIADRLAIYVNTVYNDVNSHTGLTLIIATIFFGIQIYCDFSGYTDIAIGTARIMGFKLMENFRQPYFSQSIREFWARWHISLSTWFRDYVYIPLGGNRVSLGRNLFNLFLVFLLSGLWHGAGWTFVIWGALHGVVMAAQTLLRHWGIKRIGGTDILSMVLRMLVTFAFVDFTWIFFRANSFSDAVYIIQHLFVFAPNADLSAPFFEQTLLAPQTELYLSFALIGLLFFFDAFFARWEIEGTLSRTPFVIRWGLYYALGAAVIYSGLYATGAAQFIYFQF